jgi:hypothetical protein
VFGYYLSVPSISFLIPNDADTKGLFDLTFVVGSSDILPAYESSASNSITSALEISFANSFAADLGTNLAAGSEIACLNISGLTFNTMGRIKCQLPLNFNHHLPHHHRHRLRSYLSRNNRQDTVR